jgi:hypothetical protein
MQLDGNEEMQVEGDEEMQVDAEGGAMLRPG